MEIIIGDLIDKISEKMDASKVLSIDNVYEKIENSNNLRLVISINRILYNNVNVIYTKFIFTVDGTKSKLVKNHFTYLYDINCEYVRQNFSDLSDFSDKIENIFDKNKFGENIKILSTFVKSPASLINIWFEDNDVSGVSVINVEENKIDITPCKKLSFDFSIGLNNNQKVELNISKENDNEYIFSFDIFGDIYEESMTNLKSFVETIGNTLKNKIIK